MHRLPLTYNFASHFQTSAVCWIKPKPANNIQNGQLCVDLWTSQQGNHMQIMTSSGQNWCISNGQFYIKNDDFRKKWRLPQDISHTIYKLVISLERKASYSNCLGDQFDFRFFIGLSSHCGSIYDPTSPHHPTSTQRDECCRKRGHSNTIRTKTFVSQEILVFQIFSLISDEKRMWKYQKF